MTGSIEIYVHRPAADLVVHRTDAATSVGTLVTELAGDSSASAWLEEASEPLSSDATLKEAGVADRSHVFIGTCPRVEVSVRYGGNTKADSFPPGATVQAVFAWATGPNGFDLAGKERAKHTVGICDSLVEADRSEHIGSLATDCALCLDLAPKERFQG